MTTHACGVIGPFLSSPLLLLPCLSLSALLPLCCFSLPSVFACSRRVVGFVRVPWRFLLVAAVLGSCASCRFAASRVALGVAFGSTGCVTCLLLLLNWSVFSWKRLNIFFLKKSKFFFLIFISSQIPFFVVHHTAARYCEQHPNYLLFKSGYSYITFKLVCRRENITTAAQVKPE